VSEGMRLQKFLSRAGVASRREAERMIVAGRVRVNGSAATELGTRVDPDADRVELDGRVVGVAPTRWILLNKPRGVLTTRKDPGGRPTVYGLLPPDARNLRYLGRLDRDTEGLLVFTNAGDLLHALTHPSTGVVRRYLARVHGVPDEATLARLAEGVELEDGPARFEDVAVVREVAGGGALLRLALREGRKREVRRALEAVGHRVRRLRRIAFGPLRLGDLEPGSWRELHPEEVGLLRKAAEGRAGSRGGPRGPRAGGGGKGKGKGGRSRPRGGGRS
jgi:23S rRNA pseudouridine2605 synthase